MISEQETQFTHVRVPSPLSKDGALFKLVIDRGEYIWVLGKRSIMPDFGVRVSNEDHFGYVVFSVPEQFIIEFVNGIRFRPKEPPIG